jgi:hypothetical protein
MGSGARLAVTLLLAAATPAADAEECSSAPSDGWGRNYAAYATWCKCCGGEPYSSPGVGCRRSGSWGRTACSGYSGSDVAKGGPRSFAHAAATLALAAPPEQAGAWMAAGFGLEIVMGAFSGARDAQARARAADAAREEERRRRAEEERQRLEAIHARLTGSLKVQGTWAGEAGEPTVGTLALKTDSDVFGAGRRRGGLVLKQDDESAKHRSDRVEGRALPAPSGVEGAPVPLTEFERLSIDFAERSDAAVASRGRCDGARQRKEEAGERRAEAEKRVLEIRREVGTIPREAPKEQPVTERGAEWRIPAERRDPEQGSDRLREAEELLRIAIGEERKQSDALEQAERERARAEEELKGARERLRVHLGEKGARG